ncbi:uncharacterized protein F4822DRAFT_434117 [Hypoxylon trugodes]|uniref:uncharacterized protein n=1 Tax=Hypoxylon trugodes TaxID=326681 RepID=UPI00219C8EE5|nr:uncharacterized protein F4822DRAFT_434117 [Hypoxylon trugodes]KAI1384177.1 hypothetical protein F4822DRAFT_434117 [Hypoxylon trugodes]
MSIPSDQAQSTSANNDNSNYLDGWAQYYGRHYPAPHELPQQSSQSAHELPITRPIAREALEQRWRGGFGGQSVGTIAPPQPPAPHNRVSPSEVIERVKSRLLKEQAAEADLASAIPQNIGTIKKELRASITQYDKDYRALDDKLSTSFHAVVQSVEDIRYRFDDIERRHDAKFEKMEERHNATIEKLAEKHDAELKVYRDREVGYYDKVKMYEVQAATYRAEAKAMYIGVVFVALIAAGLGYALRGI